LTANTTYTYSVLAYDAAGNNSGQSNSASATTQSDGGGGGNNHAPVLNFIGNKTISVNHILSFKVTASDRDNDSLSFVAINLPYGAKFNNTSGEFSWQPTRTGRYYITFRVSDGKLSDSETVIITVKSSGGGEDKYGIVVKLKAERKTDRSWTSKRDYGEITLNIEKGNDKVKHIMLFRKEPGQVFKAIKEFSYTGVGTIKFNDLFLKSDKTYTYKIMATNEKNAIIASSEEVSI
jgi:hypothetical protein